MSRETLKAAMESAKSSRDGVFSGAEGDAAPISLLKTAYSKNITIEEWNQLVVDMDVVLRELSADSALLTTVYSMASQLCDDADDYYNLKENAFTFYMAKYAIMDSSRNVITEYYAAKTDVAAFETVLTDMLDAAGYDYYDTSVREIFDAEVGTRTNGVFAKLNGNNAFNQRQCFNNGIELHGSAVTTDYSNFAMAISGSYSTTYKLPQPNASTNGKAYTLATANDLSLISGELKGSLDYEIGQLTAKVEQGAITALQATHSTYAVNDKAGLDIYENYVRKADVVNDLSSTATNLPLSAYQGQVIYQMIQSINNILSSDDVSLDEIQEIVAYIKSNKSLIDQITIDKISFADIIDDLTSNVQNKPLSAAQGYALKGLIDSLQSSKVSVSDIVDTLVSTAANRPLSANQGRALKALIDALDMKIDNKTVNIPYDSLATETKDLINAKSAFMLKYKETASSKYSGVILPYYELIYTDAIVVSHTESSKYAGIDLPAIEITY